MIGLGLIELAVLAFITCVILLILIIVVIGSMRPEAEPLTQHGTPRLVRMPQRGILGGVCAGFAYRVGMPTWVSRVLLVFLALASGTGVLVYLVLWIFMPKASYLPDDYESRAT